MNKITLLFLLCCGFSIMGVNAQESDEGSIPLSFTTSTPANFQTKVMRQLDVKSLRERSDAKVKTGQPLQIGEILSSGFTFINSGSWTTLKNGDRIWRLQIEAPNALATSLYFENFKLPEGAKLFVYNNSKNRQVIGAFTSRNNQPEKYFATEIVYSSTCIVEYNVPSSVKDPGQFTITGVNSIFLLPPSVEQLVNGRFKVNESGSCNVNVNCPEGANWQNQKRAVARILLREGGGSFLCTGTLLNNTAQNNKPYFLTADHCGGTASAADFNQWVFYFNYEAPSCTNPSSAPASKTITGCVQRARAANDDSGSDFQLLEFNSTIPASYNVYYAGWDATGTASNNGVSIHHPAGDIKKIATYTSPLTTVGTHHWRVFWVRTTTNWGITEGGSSGSALFNSAGLLLGDLTGGASACGVPASQAWDEYGKFSYSWTSNGTANNRRLKPWLDPTNSGVLTLQGKNGESSNTSPTATITSPVNGASFVPPASITITANATDADGTVSKVEFFNGSTKLGEDASAPYSFTWTNVPAGTYTLTARATDNTGNTGTSPAITVTVTGSTCQPVTASSDDGNVPANVLDNNLNTRWSALGTGQWIQFCLSNASSITGVQIAFYRGNERRGIFDVQVSSDGQAWNTVITNRSSSGTSLSLETFNFTSTTGKYVRIVGRGNSVNTWNSFTEVKIVTTSIAASGSLAEKEMNLQSESFNTVNFFPNPVAAGGEVTIIGLNKDAKIELVNLQGRSIKSWTNINNSSIQLDTNAGIYWVRVYGKQGVQMRRLLIK